MGRSYPHKKDPNMCSKCRVRPPRPALRTCNECAESLKDYSRTHRKEIVANALKRPKTPEQKAKSLILGRKRSYRNRRVRVRYYIWRAAKYRAGEKNLAFNITPEDIIIPEFCPLLGIPLKIADGIASANSPSLDRIIPELGYVKENIWIISKRANTLKNDASLEELELLAQSLRRVLVKRTVISVMAA